MTPSGSVKEDRVCRYQIGARPNAQDLAIVQGAPVPHTHHLRGGFGNDVSSVSTDPRTNRVDHLDSGDPERAQGRLSCDSPEVEPSYSSAHRFRLNPRVVKGRIRLQIKDRTTHRACDSVGLDLHPIDVRQVDDPITAAKCLSTERGLPSQLSWRTDAGHVNPAQVSAPNPS